MPRAEKPQFEYIIGIAFSNTMSSVFGVETIFSQQFFFDLLVYLSLVRRAWGVSRSGGGSGGLPEGVNTIWLCTISSGFNIDSFTMMAAAAAA